jgi:hypothetical protein
MKFRKKAPLLIVAALLITCFAGSLIVQAATYYNYSGAVYAITDYESSNQKKETTGSAYNNYQNSTTKGIKLVSWVENSSGTNCTYKTSYSSYKQVVMDYKDKASEHKGKYHHLNVSTQAGVVDTGVISGTWTPN